MTRKKTPGEKIAKAASIIAKVKANLARKAIEETKQIDKWEKQMAEK